MKKVGSYTVEYHEHGVLCRGEMPIPDFTMLSRAWQRQGLTELDPGISLALSATFAVTTKTGAEKWRFELKDRARQRAGHDIELGWLLGTDTGISSLTLFSVLSRHGTVARAKIGRWQPDAPQDPADFGRCLRLLDLIPSWRGRLNEVVTAHPFWGPLVREWDRLEALYREEVPNHTGNAPRLYAAMQPLIAEGYEISEGRIGAGEGGGLNA